MAYARAPKDLEAQVVQAKALAEEQFRLRMAQHEGELPLRTEAKARSGMKP